MPTPIVAIVGRANVGKSTLFNRLTEKKEALVSRMAGTTRDRKYGTAIWNAREIIFIDTGGVDNPTYHTAQTINEETVLQQKVVKQTLMAIKESNLVCHMVDYTTGVLDSDKKLAALLIRKKIPRVLIVNKCDHKNIDYKKIKMFLRLGLGDPVLVSAINGHGTDILLDKILEKLDKVLSSTDSLTSSEITPSLERLDTNIDNQQPIKIFFIGKPNAGKSSLINAVLSQERTITHSQAFTTREPQEIPFFYKNQKIILVDTVGMRKRAKIGTDLENEGVKKSMEKLQREGVAIIVLDISVPLDKQEKHLTMLAKEACNNIIIAANKWDLIEDKNPTTINRFAAMIRGHFPYLSTIPIVFTSARNKYGINNILDLVLDIQEMSRRIINDDELKPILKNIAAVKAYSFSQTNTNPQSFLLITKTKIPQAVYNIIKKRIMERFGFIGIRVNLHVQLHRKNRPV